MSESGARVAQWAMDKGIAVSLPQAYRREVQSQDYAAAYDFERSPCIDFGKFICRIPLAVLRPASEKEVCECLSYLNNEGMPFAVRGRGHSSGGQGLTDQGVVLDTSLLCDIAEGERPGQVLVGAGTPWLDVIRYLAQRGRRPHVTTSNWWTTVGGTLGVGGFGERSHQLGMQADHTSGLHLATLDGNLHQLMPGDPLFDFSLASGGSLGVMTRATIRTESGSWMLSAKRMGWRGMEDFLSAHSMLCSQDGYASLRARVQWGEDGLPVQGVAGFFCDSGTVAESWAPRSHAEMGRSERIDLYEHLSLKPTRRWKNYCPALEFFLPLDKCFETLKRVQLELLAARLVKYLPDGSAVKPLTFKSRLPLAPYPSSEGGVMVAIRPEVPYMKLTQTLQSLRKISEMVSSAGGTFYLISIPLELPAWLERQAARQLPEWLRLIEKYDEKGLIKSGPRPLLINGE